MKKHFTLALLCCIPLNQVIADDMEQRVEQSRAVVKEFGGALKTELKKAIKEGGALQAITVCNTVAPAIAKHQSTKHGWDVGRTSLKPRNPDNAPDSWEKSVLEEFEARKQAGESPAKMEYFAIVEQDGKKEFRYMKAIPVKKKPCLACHGTNIKAEIATALDKLYLDDKARGYKAGDIRGAFSITQPM